MSSKANRRNNMRALVRARHLFGLFGKRGGGKREVFATVAAALGIRLPGTNAQRYEMLRSYLANRDAAVPQRLGVDPNADEFLKSYEWRRLRMTVLKKFGARCQCCGATPADGVKMHVDHIKPRRLHPELALTESNLQVLCEVCNHGKGNWDQTDWRPKTDAPTIPANWYEPMWAKGTLQ